MTYKQFTVLVLLLLITALPTLAQQSGPVNSTGQLWMSTKFIVVTTVLLTILLGIVVFLITLELQVKRLEKKLTDKN